jgi:hypothetical protein
MISPMSATESIRAFGNPVFYFDGWCQDGSIRIERSTLYFYELESLMKVLMTKEVLPPYVSISHIRSFEDMCKYLIFPFMQLYIPHENESSID